MGRFLVPLGLFVLVASFLLVGLKLDPREVPSPLIGKPAPAFSLNQLHESGKTISDKDLRGQVWVLNVWASWCVSCREEHPLLVEFAKRKEVPLYGLNYKDGRAEALRWLSERGNPYVMSIVDADGRTGIDYGVYGVPETYVIDKAGVIRMKHIGPVTPTVLETKLLPLVRELKKS
jgi:cytochrome c biogenesis protein CcmG/thiol:disulfide interchange protein DsbE